MKRKNINSIIAAFTLAVSLAGGLVLPALAQIAQAASSSAPSAVGANLIVRVKDRANREIDRRIKALNALEARIQAMKKLTDSQKISLNATIQSQIADLTSLKAKINADTDLVTLRADVQSITKAYRIYRLVIPQGSILVAADRALSIAGDMNALGAKLQARIAADQSAGKNVSPSTAAFADFNAKVSDAKVQAQAAITEVSGLTPDNGDQAKFQANLAAMKDARSKIRAAQQDFVAARKDAGVITRALRALNKGNHASSTTEASGTVENH